MIDDLWEVAGATGLLPVLGTSMVQVVLANAFGGAAR
jgi:hypothetical protein